MIVLSASHSCSVHCVLTYLCAGTTQNLCIRLVLYSVMSSNAVMDMRVKETSACVCPFVHIEHVPLDVYIKCYRYLLSQQFVMTAMSHIFVKHPTHACAMLAGQDSNVQKVKYTLNMKLKKFYKKCTLNIDIDECQSPGVCEHHCINTASSYLCSCPGGSVLADDQSSCIGWVATPTTCSDDVYMSCMPACISSRISMECDTTCHQF